MSAMLFSLTFFKSHAQGCAVSPLRQIVDCSTGEVTFSVDPTNLSSLSYSAATGFNTISSYPPNLAAGTITFYDMTFSNYKGFGTVSIDFTYASGLTCKVEVKIAECCQSGTPTYLFIEDVISAGTYGGTTWFYGDNMLEDGVVFSNGEAEGATDARLILDRGAEVTFDNTILSKLCEYRWDGIYAGYSDNVLNITNNSEVQDALRAVFGENNAYLDIDNTRFSDNITSMKIEDYTTAGSPYGSHVQIDDVDFEHPNTLSSFEQHPSSTIDMTKHFVSDCGSATSYRAPIFILNSVEVGIGQRQYGTNNFTAVGQDLVYITLVNSYARIRNNDFDGNAGYAVCSNDESRVIFGGINPAAGNVIDSKVVSFNSTENFQNNQINGGVEINTPYYQAIGTGYTDATNFDSGNDFNNCTLVVNGNTANTQVRIKNNDFVNSTVYIEDVRGVSSPFLRSVIFNDNTMTMTSASVTNSAVTLISCEEAVVGDNSITHSAYTVTGTSNFPAGLRLFGLYDGLVARNTITGFESGIYLAGNFGNTQFQCNVLSDHYNGFYLNYPDLDDQGDATVSPAIPNNNQWFNSSNFDITGAVSTSYIHDWYYDDDNGAFPQFRPTLSVINLPQPTLGTGTLNCLNITVPNFKMANSAKEKSDRPFNESEAIQNDDKSQEVFLAYPNPTQDILHIEFPERFSGQEFVISDLNGRTVLWQEINRESIQIDMISWPQGVYLLKAGKEVIRIIKL